MCISYFGQKLPLGSAGTMVVTWVRPKLSLVTTWVRVTTWPGGGTHDIFGRGCATIKSLYRPFLEFLTKKLDPFRNFCA